MDAIDFTGKATVLVVDDTPDNLALLSGLLKDDYKVKVANNGERALKIAASDHPPDLILLDIMMPGMDGYEVCRRLQDDPETRRIPIIFVTAKREIEDEKIGLYLGAVDYISKPYQISILKARVRTHIRLKRQANLLESLAMIDELTHIPNRRRFNDVLDAEWRRSCRNGTPLSLLMVDIDFFKAYNDHYGHGMGDTCLAQVAEMLATVVNRPGDLPRCCFSRPRTRTRTSSFISTARAARLRPGLRFTTPCSSSVPTCRRSASDRRLRSRRCCFRPVPKGSVFRSPIRAS